MVRDEAPQAEKPDTAAPARLDNPITNGEGNIASYFRDLEKALRLSAPPSAGPDALLQGEVAYARSLQLLLNPKNWKALESGNGSVFRIPEAGVSVMLSLEKNGVQRVIETSWNANSRSRTEITGPSSENNSVPFTVTREESNPTTVYVTDYVTNSEGRKACTHAYV